MEQFPWLHQKLSDHQTDFETYEETFRSYALSLLAQPRCLLRDNFTPGHFTGSAFVVNPARTHTLLIHHPQLKLWFQPGGHADGEENLCNVAKRELEEESGYPQSAMHLPQGDALFQIDIHPIPARDKNGRHEPAHLHFDARFLIELDHTQPIPGSPENQVLKWMTFAEAEALFPVHHGRWHMLQKAKKV